ncbi:ATP-dependent DNA helicase [Mycena chlorophos]|uniref:ATP-dependent DNA helicase n=1 Tax=Mycena chlorophos TaxID=658473 RepID=A0A8H6RXZ6_MYCCL|nr:ATP-dependent DNA helicase [Mycena chlorophos]
MPPASYVRAPGMAEIVARMGVLPPQAESQGSKVKLLSAIVPFDGDGATKVQIRFFDNNNDLESWEGTAICDVRGTVAAADADVMNIAESEHTAAKDFTMVIDAQSVTFIGKAQSLDWDYQQPAQLYLTGVAFDQNKDNATFQMDVETFSYFMRVAGDRNKAFIRLLFTVPSEGRWAKMDNNKKPTPANKRVTATSGVLTGVDEELDGAAIIRIFRVKLSNVQFFGSYTPVATTTRKPNTHAGKMEKYWDSVIIPSFELHVTSFSRSNSPATALGPADSFKTSFDAQFAPTADLTSLVSAAINRVWHGKGGINPHAVWELSEEIKERAKSLDDDLAARMKTLSPRHTNYNLIISVHLGLARFHPDFLGSASSCYNQLHRHLAVLSFREAAIHGCFGSSIDKYDLEALDPLYAHYDEFFRQQAIAALAGFVEGMEVVNTDTMELLK